ncbi:MAG: response regulator [Deltaproteobacteria bacterium]|nr:response regulator [Deltaproteobacteria bacterium]
MSKILVVDDEQNIRFVYREVLTDEGYDVIEAESAEGTFDILNRELIDLVLLDIKLRSESGLHILKRIATEFPNTPVLLCSAYVSFQNDYTSWLADGYIVKSSDPEELLNEVDKVLKKRGKV